MVIVIVKLLKITLLLFYKISKTPFYRALLVAASAYTFL